MALSYVFWHYGRGLQGVFRIVGNFFLFGVHLFSLPQLTRSLFAPWRNIAISSRGAVLSAAWWNAISLNIFSRFLGAIARCCLIVVGILFLFAVGLLGALLLLVWLAGPFLPVLCIALGIQLLP